LFGKFILCIMVRIRVSDMVRVSGMVNIKFRVSVRISKVALRATVWLMWLLDTCTWQLCV